MTALKGDMNILGFVGDMREAPEGWEKATIVSCESAQRAALASTSDQSDKIFYHIRVRGDKEDLLLEVQCLAWLHRCRTRFMAIAGLLTRDGETVPYWASIDLEQRKGELRMTEENFTKIGFAPERMSAF